MEEREQYWILLPMLGRKSRRESMFIANRCECLLTLQSTKGVDHVLILKFLRDFLL